MNLDLAHPLAFKKGVFVDELFRETQLSGIRHLPSALVKGFLNAAEPPCRACRHQPEADARRSERIWAIPFSWTRASPGYKGCKSSRRSRSASCQRQIRLCPHSASARMFPFSSSPPELPDRMRFDDWSNPLGRFSRFHGRSIAGVKHHASCRVPHRNPIRIEEFCKLPDDRYRFRARGRLRSMYDRSPDRPADVQRIAFVVRPFQSSQFPFTESLANTLESGRSSWERRTLRCRMFRIKRYSQSFRVLDLGESMPRTSYKQRATI